MPNLFFLGAMAVALMGSLPATAGEHNSPIHNPSDASGFQPVDLNSVEKVNGKALTTIAYGIIFGVFVLYALSLLRREQTVEKNVRKLRQHLNQKK